MSQNRSIAKCIVLSIITCGIYGMYWFVVATDDVGRVTNRPGTSGGVSLVLSIVTCGIYGLYWAWTMGDKLDAARDVVDAFERGFPADYDGRDLAVAYVGLAADEDQVAIEVTGLHAVALDAQGEIVFAGVDGVGDFDIFVVLLVGRDRCAGGDLADDRHAAQFQPRDGDEVRVAGVVNILVGASQYGDGHTEFIGKRLHDGDLGRALTAFISADDLF